MAAQHKPSPTPQPERGEGRARVRAPAGTPPRARRVLLVVDFINPLDFDGAGDLAAPAVLAAAATAQLKAALCARGVPVIYVNDNFGRWQSDFQALVAHCRRLKGPAGAMVRHLAPSADDLTVLKPRHSAFYQTPLELLLTQMGTRELVITGLATDLCVKFSAMDAFVRGYRLWVPEDCTAAESPARHRAALDWMALALRCRTAAAATGTVTD